jgi:hypothetical protein
MEIAREVEKQYNLQPNRSPSRMLYPRIEIRVTLVQVLSSGWVVSTKRWADAHFFFGKSF